MKKYVIIVFVKVIFIIIGDNFHLELEIYTKCGCKMKIIFKIRENAERRQN